MPSTGFFDQGNFSHSPLRLAGEKTDLELFIKTSAIEPRPEFNARISGTLNAAAVGQLIPGSGVGAFRPDNDQPGDRAKIRDSLRACFFGRGEDPDRRSSFFDIADPGSIVSGRPGLGCRQPQGQDQLRKRRSLRTDSVRGTGNSPPRGLQGGPGGRSSHPRRRDLFGRLRTTSLGGRFIPICPDG